MRRFWALMAASSLTFAIPAVTITSQAIAAPAGNLSAPRALLVCNGSTSPCPHGVRHYKTVQAAVNAAHPGDWVLIWPGRLPREEREVADGRGLDREAAHPYPRPEPEQGHHRRQ
jgi:hypothetical protein